MCQKHQEQSSITQPPQHGHQHEELDQWAGKEYLANPEILKLAQMSYDFIIQSITFAGTDEEVYRKWDILEIGCGPGVVTKHLLPTFHTVHSIDTSPSMLTYLTTYLPPNTYPNFSYSLHTLSPDSGRLFAERVPLKSPTAEDPNRQLPSPRARFDLAVVNWVLHHVDGVQSFMAGAVGLLKEGGWLVITEMGRREGGHAIDDKSNEQGSFNAPDHYRAAYTPQQLVDLFESHGLIDVHADMTQDFPVFRPASALPLKEGEERKMIPALIVRGKKGIK
ncbi:hypothetical protein V866_005223 [Kwoniella sp. B9012]|uniref:Methyltransferase type 12 domain-containing protein n=1 Tax=Kwoniella europaea PYCC6329 TaxID=1423913 RepID=A0AAX4KND0_9TREE